MTDSEQPETSPQCTYCGAVLSSRNHRASAIANEPICQVCAWRRAADPAHKSRAIRRREITEPLTYHLDGDTNAPTNIVLLLPGLGTNGENMRAIARELANRIPRTVFVSPDAPWQLIEAMPYEDALWSRAMQRDRDWSTSRSWLADLAPTESEKRQAVAQVFSCVSQDVARAIRAGGRTCVRRTWARYKR